MTTQKYVIYVFLYVTDHIYNVFLKWHSLCVMKWQLIMSTMYSSSDIIFALWSDSLSHFIYLRVSNHIILFPSFVHATITRNLLGCHVSLSIILLLDPYVLVGYLFLLITSTFHISSLHQPHQVLLTKSVCWAELTCWMSNGVMSNFMVACRL